MVDRRATRSRSRRPPKPLDRARLEELALAYVARFATTAAKLETYLLRKLRERGFEGDEAPDIAALVESFVAKKYVDDAVYGRSTASGLLARGYGPHRVEQALRGAGIDAELRDEFSPDEAQKRAAAQAMARKRRFGPYGGESEEAPELAYKRREKQLAAMVRAGHDFDMARTVLDAATIEEIEEWVEQACD